MSAKVTIIGNLGRDPETRVNANKTFIANFSIAVNNQRKSATGESVKKADWYNITATGKQAQILAEYAHKGDPLLIEGKQTFSEWTDREGNQRRSVDILVQDFRFLGMGGNRSDESQAAPDTATSQIPDDIRSAMHAAPDDLDFSGDNFPSVM
jgi:single-strand DNA-binding protein